MSSSVSAYVIAEGQRGPRRIRGHSSYGGDQPTFCLRPGSPVKGCHRPASSRGAAVDDALRSHGRSAELAVIAAAFDQSMTVKATRPLPPRPRRCPQPVEAGAGLRRRRSSRCCRRTGRHSRRRPGPQISRCPCGRLLTDGGVVGVQVDVDGVIHTGLVLATTRTAAPSSRLPARYRHASRSGRRRSCWWPKV